MDIETLRHLKEDYDQIDFPRVKHDVESGDLSLSSLAIDLDYFDSVIDEIVFRYLADDDILYDHVSMSVNARAALNALYLSARSPEERANVQEFIDFEKATTKLAIAYSQVTGVPLIWYDSDGVVPNYIPEL
jgi:hypothetical protein